MPTSKPLTPPRAAAMANTALFDAVDVDAALLRGIAVERRRAHGPTELGETQESIEQQGAGDTRCPRSASRVRRWSRRLSECASSGTWLAMPRGSGVNSSCATWSSTRPTPIVDSSGAIRGELLQRTQGDALNRHAEEAATGDDGEQRHRQRRAEMGQAQPSDVRPHHVDGAVREIYEVRDAVDQGKADGEQGIDVADHEAVDGVVEPGAEKC